MSQLAAKQQVSLLEKETTYKPFMAAEAITLTARMVQNFICTPTRSGKLCDDRQAVRFVMLCKARLLNPFEGDAYLIGYDSNDGPQFSLITAHQAFLKRAEVHPEYDGMDSGVIVRDEAGQLVDRIGDFFLDTDCLLGGWATVYFKSRKHPMHKRLKLSTFSTGKSRWQKDPAGMIVKCAEADALRSSFPTSLGGMYLQEEMGVGSHEIDVARPSTPPMGRVVMRNVAAQRNSLPHATNGNGNGNGHHDHEVIDAPGETPETNERIELAGDPGPREPGDDDLNAQDALDAAIERINQAGNTRTWKEVGTYLADSAQALGGEGSHHYAQALARWQERSKELKILNAPAFPTASKQPSSVSV